MKTAFREMSCRRLYSKKIAKPGNAPRKPKVLLIHPLLPRATVLHTQDIPSILFNGAGLQQSGGNRQPKEASVILAQLRVHHHSWASRLVWNQIRCGLLWGQHSPCLPENHLVSSLRTKAP